MLSCMNIGRSLAEDHPKDREGQAAHHAHASWCPQSLAHLPNRGQGVCSVDVDEEAREHAKKQKPAAPAAPAPAAAAAASTSNEDSSSASSASSSSGAAAAVAAEAASACVCELSTALPARVRVNGAFERLFGWSQAEIESGVHAEGLSFLRNLYPVSIWPVLSEIQMSQRKSLFEFTRLMAIAAWKQASRDCNRTKETTPAGMAAGMAAGMGAVAMAARSDGATLECHGAAAVTVGGDALNAALPLVAPEEDNCVPPIPIPIPPLGPFPHLSHTISTDLQNKWGTVLPCLLVKHTSMSDEETTQRGAGITGFVYSWQPLPTTTTTAAPATATTAARP